MLPIGAKIIISGGLFFVGALMGREFIRAAQRTNQTSRTGEDVIPPKRRGQSLLIFIGSVLAGAISAPLLSLIPDAILFGVMLAAGIVAATLFYMLRIAK